MRKRIYFFTLILLFVAGQAVNAQVTIGSSADPRVTLDVRAVAPDNQLVVEGFLAPQLTRAQLDTKNASYKVEHAGTIVYVTNTDPAASTTASTAMITSIGYYYFNGETWQPISGNVAGTLRTGLFDLIGMMRTPDPVVFEDGDFVYITDLTDATPAGATIAITKPGYYYWSAATNAWLSFEGGELNVTVGEGLHSTGTHITHIPHTGDVTGSTDLTIVDGKVTEAKLAANAVTVNKIKDGEITAAKLAADAAITSQNVLNALGATAGDNEKFLRGDGTWATPESGSVASSRPNLIVTTEQNPSPTAAQLSADVTVILCTYTGMSLGTFTFPALTAADKGKLLQISVSTGGGAVGNFSGATIPALAGGNIPNLMGATFMWDGTTWFRYSR